MSEVLTMMATGLGWLSYCWFSAACGRASICCTIREDGRVPKIAFVYWLIPVSVSFIPSSETFVNVSYASYLIGQLWSTYNQEQKIPVIAYETNAHEQSVTWDKWTSKPA